MKFNLREYNIIKTKHYLKKNTLFFFANGVNQNSLDWLLTEQGLKTVGFTSYKLSNRINIKTSKNSLFNNTQPLIKGSVFFVRPNSNKIVLSKHFILDNFSALFFVLLAIKLNNKIYPLFLEKIYFLDYYKNKFLFYQFNITNLKFCFRTIIISNTNP